MERRTTLGENRESTVIIMLSTDRFLYKVKSNWLNQKQSTGYRSGWKICTHGQEVGVSGKKSKSG